MKRIENLTLDEERALYGLEQAEISACTFAGPADGESALKETRDLTVTDCQFLLRYPLWHTRRAVLTSCTMTDTCRAALWYDQDVTMENCRLGGIKVLRECDRSILRNCDIVSQEFAWFCRGVEMTDCELQSEYPFLQSCDLKLNGLQMKGKYSFQYVENAELHNCKLDTKDAFWHSRNVTVYDSEIKGEYLAWHSENLHLVRCRIIGTQPLCYARGLVLEDCEMVDCDLSFEKSEVQATIRGCVDSVKNPVQGRIEAGHIGEVILDEPTSCEIISRVPQAECA